MVRRNSHVIRRENDVLEVDFSREPDPACAEISWR
jgi:hypothetical protein